MHMSVSLRVTAQERCEGWQSLPSLRQLCLQNHGRISQTPRSAAHPSGEGTLLPKEEPGRARSQPTVPRWP